MYILLHLHSVEHRSNYYAATQNHYDDASRDTISPRDTISRWIETIMKLAGVDTKVFKDSYSFETRMCGTVKCRPTLAFRIHFYSINNSTELITRYYYSNEKLA